MSTPAFYSGDLIPKDAIPANLVARVGPDAPERMRGIIARAVLPMPPEELGVALGILARDPNPDIAKDAQASLLDMPSNVTDSVVASELPGPVLDVFAHCYQQDLNKLQRIVANRATLDTTVAWMARRLRGTVLDYIASNQVRIVRSPEIIAAMIANPSAPTPLLARVVETAIRNDVDTGSIPGFKQLAAAFFSDIAPEALVSELRQEEEEPQEAVEAPDDFDEEKSLEEFNLTDLDSGFGIDDAELEALLTGRVVTDSDTGANKPLWKLIEEMSLPQKVRLALMGDSSARKILVRDPKKTVSTAVLRSPKITEKEIATIVMDKAIDGEIIRMIARQREWTRHYQVMVNLVMNPKCPPQQAMQFIKSLRRRDLTAIARAKNVASPIRRAAKGLMEKRGV